MNVLIGLGILIGFVAVVMAYALCCVSAKCSREEERRELEEYLRIKQDRKE